MKLLIVNFHYIGDQNRGNAIFPRSLKQIIYQVDVLSKYYKFISNSDLINYQNLSSKYNYCMLTFDDGLAEQMEAFRLLVQVGVPATFFVTTQTLTGKYVTNVHKTHLLRDKLGDAKIWKYLINMYPEVERKIPDNIESFYRYDSGTAKRLKFAINFLLEYSDSENFINRLFLGEFELGEVAKSLYMTENDVLTLANLDSLGAHGHTHTAFSQLGVKELAEEIDAMGKCLGRITPIKNIGISYPFGGPAAVTDTAVEQCKIFCYGLTMRRGLNDFSENVNFHRLLRVDTNDAPGGKFDSMDYVL